MKRLILLTALFLITSSTIHAQSFPGRVSFGVDAEGNKYWGNFTDNQFWFSGDAFLRYNILDWLSLHAAYNGGQLRIKNNEQNLKTYPNYYGPYGAGVGTQSRRDQRDSTWRLSGNALGQFFPHAEVRAIRHWWR